MDELKEIVRCILIVLYGTSMYVIGRTNFVENVIIPKIIDLLEHFTENGQTDKGE